MKDSDIEFQEGPQKDFDPSEGLDDYEKADQ